MTGAIVATSIVFFPAAPLFLFMHGKDITIPQGTEIVAFADGDMHLDMAKFGVSATSLASAPSSAPATQASVSASVSDDKPATEARLTIESDPTGADVEIDGSFVGS